MIIIPTIKDEKWEAAEKALEIRIRISGSSFKDLLISSIFQQLRNQQLQLDERETLELYEAVKEIQANTPKGLKYIDEFKTELIINFMKEQEAYDSEQTN